MLRFIKIHSFRYLMAFTLMELLTVLTVIAILVALMLPVLTSINKRKDTAICISNMRQITSAIFQYCADNDGRLPATWETPYTADSYWASRLGVYFSESQTNKYVGRDYLQCPTQRAENKRMGRGEQMTYGVFYTGSGPSFTSTPLFALRRESGRAMNFRLDTILVGESSTGIIYSPSVWKLDQDNGASSSKHQEPYNYAKFPHDNRMTCGFADGSVRQITLAEWRDGAGKLKLP